MINTVPYSSVVWLVFIESQLKVKLSLGLIRIITECLNGQKLLLGSRTLHKIFTNSWHKKIRNTRLTRSQLFLEANKMRALEFFTNDFEKFGRALILIVRQSWKLTAPQINSAAHSWPYQMIIFLQIFLAWETGSEVIFSLSRVEK